MSGGAWRRPSAGTTVLGHATEPELPSAVAHPLQAAAVVVEEALARRARTRLAGEDRPHVATVEDAIAREARSGETREGRHQVHAGDQLARALAAHGVAGPASDEGHAQPTFERRLLPTAQWRVRSPAAAGAVVRGEDDERARVETQPLQRRQHITDRSVDLLDRVAVDAASAPPGEGRARVGGLVRHAVGKEQEEGSIARRLDEADRLVGVSAREQRLIGLGLDHRLAAHQGQRKVPGVAAHRAPAQEALAPAVVGMEQTEEAVESVPRRQQVRLIAEMPLARERGGVARRAQELGQRDLGRGEAARRARVGRQRVASLVETDAPRVRRGQDRRARRHAPVAGRVEAGKADALGGEPRQVRRAVDAGAVDLDVAVAEVVGEEEDEVGRRRLSTVAPRPRRR